MRGEEVALSVLDFRVQCCHGRKGRHVRGRGGRDVRKRVGASVVRNLSDDVEDRMSKGMRGGCPRVVGGEGRSCVRRVCVIEGCRQVRDYRELKERSPSETGQKLEVSKADLA